MSFFIFILVGFIGGIVGGMGMGGGTLLIPMLTIFCGVEQKVSQAINLFAFIPTAIFALAIHINNNLVEKDNVWWIIIPALLFSVGGSLLALVLPQIWLKRGFGVFLILLAIYQFICVIKKQKKATKRE